MGKKINTRSEIISWFGEKHINVKEVLEKTDNRVMFGMYKAGILLFDSETCQYFVNKEVCCIKQSEIDYFGMCNNSECIPDFNQSPAFIARLEYEKNCIAKYDRPNRPSIAIPEGERMSDFAYKFGCTVKEMKDVLPEVERFLGN